MTEKPKSLSTGIILLLAASAGFAVGNLYWAQPLLSAIANSFDLPASQGGFLVSITQMGYALGLLLFVPLGDVVERRKLLSLVILATIAALFACAWAPSFSMLSAALFCMGLFTISGQIILPLAGDLANPAERGRIVGLITSGITSGILFSRLVSGLIADIWGWRSIYFLAALINFVMLAAIGSLLPKIPAKENVSYPTLLLGVLTSVKRYPMMRGILLKQGLVFGITFNLFWTALTFLLSGEPFFFNTTQIGLVSLAGLTGTLAGAKLGALQDRGLGYGSLTLFIGLSTASMAIATVSQKSIVLIVLVAAVFSLAVQGIGILSQTQLFALTDTERSRLNTAFVVSNFLFCAIGSSMATLLWDMGKWQAVTIGGVLASSLALLIHRYGTKREAT
ncbi:MAG: MFS transporter [Desulfovibrio sp.]|nr:MFS transporter [Desulfovibrio sp.]